MNRRQFLLFICFTIAILFSNVSGIQAQSATDSLKNKIIASADSRELCDLYYEIATEYYYIHSDSSILYTRKYLNESYKLDDPRSIADALYWMADLYYYSNLDSAYHYCEKYLEQAEILQDTTWIGDAYQLMAYANYQEGKIELAYENFQTALKYYLLVNDKYQIGASYNNIGFTISYDLDQPSGLNYFLKALEIAEEINDTSLISDVTSNIAYYHDRIKDYSSAHKFYQQSYDMDMSLGDSTTISQSSASLAYIDIKMGNFDEALTLLENSKKHISQMHNPYLLSDLYSTIIECYLEWSNVDSAQQYLDKLEGVLSLHQYPIQDAYLDQQLGFLYFLKKDYRNCITYLDRSIVRFRDLNSLESFALIYKKRAESFAALNLHKEAYESQLRANSITDSLKYGEVAALLSKLEQDRFHKAVLEQTQLEAELTAQLAEINRIRYSSNLKLALITIILLVILVGIVFYTLFSIREKNERLKSNNELINNQKLQLKQQLDMLKSSEHELFELNATKDRFFSIIAHDLRNPFYAIMGLSKLYIDDKEHIKQDEILPIIDGILTASKSGYSLLENLLKWAQSQAGTLVPKPEKISIEGSVKKIVSEMTMIAGSKSIAIEVDCKHPDQVFADENMLNTILRNLIHNAIKFSYENSVIKIFTYKKNQFLVCCVEDQGIGLSRDELKNLFSIDGQVRKKGTSKEEGSGLGLILCKEFVEKNKGEIWATGRENKGSSFSFSLPLLKEN